MLIIEQGVLATPAVEIAWLVAGVVPPEVPPDCDAAWLTVDEAAACRALKTVKRQNDWLRGRIVSKTLLQQLVRAQTGRDLSLDQIEVIGHPDGWPQVTFLAAENDLPAFTLSLSHSRELAFCAAVSDREALLGADMEFVESRSAAFVSDYFTLAERELLQATDSSQLSTVANAIWSGKEAALKAIRRGLAEDTRIVSCLPQATGSAAGWQRLTIRWEKGEWPKLTGWWRTVGEHVLTIAAGG